MNRDRPQWADKLRFWLTDDLYEHSEKRISAAHGAVVSVLHAIEGRIENGVESLEAIGLRAPCLRFGHKPVPDQCDKPEHDFCAYCNKAMPYSAHGPQY